MGRVPAQEPLWLPSFPAPTVTACLFIRGARPTPVDKTGPWPRGAGMLEIWADHKRQEKYVLSNVLGD